MPQTRFFVINLPQQTERRASILDQFRKINIEPELIQAVDGRRLDDETIATHYSQTAANEKNGREMTLGEIGCALSHQSVYRKMIDERISWAMIVEDDAALGNDFLELLDVISKQINSSTSEIILFSHVERYTQWGRKRIFDRYSLVKPTRANGSQCYLLTVTAAHALLRLNYPICRPIDRWIDFMKSDAVRIRAIVPYCVGLATCEKDSTIEPERKIQKASAPPKSYLWSWIEKYLYRKLLYKLVYNLLIKIILREKKQKLA